MKSRIIVLSASPMSHGNDNSAKYAKFKVKDITQIWVLDLQKKFESLRRIGRVEYEAPLFILVG